MIIVSPSVLSADYTDLTSQFEKLNESKAQWVHYDVMDGNFVPNLTFGPDILKAINKLSDRFMDVHVMVMDPLKVLTYFEGCRIDMYTFHYEATQERTAEVIAEIRSKGKQVGISIKPNTPVSAIEPYLDQVDMVLVMSVEPGFGGQKFMPESLNKLDQLHQYRVDHNLNYLLQIDGGINGQTGKLAVEHHCDSLVAGSYVFKHPVSMAKAVEELMGE